MNVIKFLLTGTPFYPHWLEFRNSDYANELLYKKIKGDVIEVGCGNGSTKKRVLQQYGNKIHSYIATDYTSWDTIFKHHNQKVHTLGLITSYLYGKSKSANSVDKVCDALNLPFKDKTFDTYLATEVLEHINQPNKFFSEAGRVLKKKGTCLISVPFIYREHSDGTGYDYFRYTKSCLNNLATENGFLVNSIFTKSFFGTSTATIINQYIIRKITESIVPIKILLLIFSPFIFFTTNLAGLLIDTLDKDDRFATRYHLILTKK
jgi:ubiquinone/menaquinone biosynthesis C-methylase UbiE